MRAQIMEQGHGGGAKIGRDDCGMLHDSHRSNFFPVLRDGGEP